MKKDKFTLIFNKWLLSYIPFEIENNYIKAILMLRYIQMTDEGSINIIPTNQLYYSEVTCNNQKVITQPYDLEDATIEAVSRYKDLFNQNY